MFVVDNVVVDVFFGRRCGDMMSIFVVVVVPLCRSHASASLISSRI